MSLHTPISTIFFDIGDTLVYDSPPLFERVRMALAAGEIAHDANDLAPAYRAAENHAMERYLEGIPFDSPDTLAAASAIILAGLGVDDPAYQKLAAMGEHFASIPYQRTVHPAALELLDELRRRGFQLAVVSDWDPDLSNVLTALGIRHDFDALAVSAIVGCTKPNPRLFRNALARTGADAARSLHIGDYYELDVAGARSVGIQPLLFDWKGRHPEADCMRVTTFDELAEALLELPLPT